MKKTTKLLSLLIAGVLILAAVIVPTLADEATQTVGFKADAVEAKDLTEVEDISTYEAGSDVTEYKISDSDGWLTFAGIVNASNTPMFANVTIYIAADIDFMGEEVVPVGYRTAKENGSKYADDKSVYFAGTLDGQGHKFSNYVLEMAPSMDNTCIGLFSMATGTIKNLILDDSCSITMTAPDSSLKNVFKNYTGCAAFVAYGYKTLTIDNCWNQAEVSTECPSAGGFVGRYMSKVVMNSTNSGKITATTAAGGVAAYEGPTAIANCLNTGTITASRAAGMVARQQKSTTISGCVNTGKIVGVEYAAGIVGVDKACTARITGCTNSGEIVCDEKAGIVYQFELNATISKANCTDLTGIDPVEEETTTEAPTTEAPTTEAPTTEAPTTEAPTTEAPTTEAPTTEAPTTEAPTTEAPTTEAPTTEAPTTEAPATDAPADDTAKSGCSATVIGGISVIVLVSAAAVTLLKKKED